MVAIGGAPDAVQAQRGYLVTSMDLSSRAGHLCGCIYVGPRRATTGKGYFKDLSANYIVLLIVLCLWKEGAFFQFLWPKHLLS